MFCVWGRGDWWTEADGRMIEPERLVVFEFEGGASAPECSSPIELEQLETRFAIANYLALINFITY